MKTVIQINYWSALADEAYLGSTSALMGLIGVKAMADADAMIFYTSRSSTQVITMDGMSIPIDVILTNGEEVIETLENLKPDSGKHYTAHMGDPFIEVAAGVVKTHNIKPGDKVIRERVFVR